jgi:predicted phosphodiesterase
MSSCEQVILSAQETADIYARLSKAEKDAADAKLLYTTLQASEVIPCDSYRFNFFGDAGDPGDKQDALKSVLELEDPHAIFQAGDNTYSNSSDCADIIADQIFLEKWINECRVFRCGGNHDYDVEPQLECSYDLYPYLPGNRRYYNKYFKHTGTEIFVLSDGANTLGALTEPDGNTVGSIQWEWFTAAIAASKAKYKIVMWHEPLVSQQSGATCGLSTRPQMDWLYEEYGVDLVINGHSHLNAHHRIEGVDYVNISAPVRDIRKCRTGSDEPYCISELAGYGRTAELVYKDVSAGDDYGVPQVGRITVSAQNMLVEFLRISDMKKMHCFTIENCNDMPVDEFCTDESYCGPCVSL